LRQGIYRPYSIFAGLVLPAFARGVATSAQMQFVVDATRLACALERSRMANGKRAGTLEALAPRFITAVPNDLVGGQPLHYRPTTNDAYVVYSIGWNESDDGGQLAWKPENQHSVDIMNGDWVWNGPSRK